MEDEKNKNNPNYKPGNKRKNKNKKKEDKDITYQDFTKCDFPLPYSDKRLIEGWYEFNDATVKPITPGTLQSQFGGTHGGNAYMLIYRQRKMNQHDGKEPEIPVYAKDKIETANVLFEEQRAAYNDLRDQVDMIIQDEDEYFQVTEAEVEKGIKVPVFSYKDQYTKDSSTEFQKAGESHRIRLSESFAQVDFNFGL